ncbi:TMV resistance protein N-like isoform X2 [Solanum dulcamara]|uniref:TMV resistance protein N-like isoform X2 n=1 Tax=Solanum dulcamara TaxID=45834 RepID=UPI0024851E49|nr:TMV resistance protein N-like isoform X2 [Solanum dulcamara]
MESISSSVSNSHYCPQWKYDVFLSFRGEDTRETFMGYLYERLTRRGIITFQDNKRLEHGDSIPEELSKAIKDSQVVLVIFSKNYATSRWCLDELVNIMECAKDENDQKTIIPVFYGVDVTDVRNQSKSFGEAFAKHELKYKDDGEAGIQKVQRWRTALTAAANLKGYVFPNGVESDCIERIVDVISSKCKTSVSYSHKVVGIDTQLEKVESLLEMGIDDVRIVWIWGMGGIGKTTIANAIYNKLSSSKFKDACLLEDIKEKKHKMYSLQNILLSKLLGEKENCVNNKEEGRSLIARRLRFKKVLVVLDDIDHRDQLDYLAGDLHWFGKGSRIIATTRDKRLIGNNVLHEVETLIDGDAIKLFNQYAFMEKVPDVCFNNLTLEIVSHAKGHPLALKVWGSLLHGKGMIVWRSALDRIRENSGSEIIENLKISYDGLEPNEKEIFLDIACFFRGKEKKQVMQILESCDFPAEYGLNVLIDKSLVFISDHNKIQMHDLIQDMGQYIVKMQKHPGERSRLWKTEDVKEVMVDNMVFLPSLRKLDLSYSKSLIRTPDFTGMPNLEYLNLRGCTSLKEVHHSLGCSRKLIQLDLYHCERLERFPRVNVESLKSLDLLGCSSLEKFPEILGKMKLELEIHMRFTWIRELPSSVIQHQARLRVLDLSDMKKLVALPSSVCKLKSLVKLDVSYCSKLESLPEEIRDLENLEELHARHTLISRPPSSIVCLNKLKFLTFAKQESEDGVYFVFPQVNGGLHSFEILNLGCCNLIDGGLPEDIGCLHSLKRLYLSRNNFHHLPRSIAQLVALRSLNLSHCKKLKQLPEFPEQLDTIYADWSKHSICNSLFQNISLLQHDISTSDSLSLRLFTSRTLTIPTWFHSRRTGKIGLVNLPENWYVPDNFLGFAVCYTGRLMYVTMTTHLIPLCYDSKLWMTLKLDLLEPDSNCLVRKYSPDSVIHFFFVPFAGLWNTSKANGKTPNDYGRIMLSFSGDVEYGFRLLYKDVCIGTRRSRYDSSKHPDSVTNEASCSSSKKQRSHF